MNQLVMTCVVAALCAVSARLAWPHWFTQGGVRRISRPLERAPRTKTAPRNHSDLSTPMVMELVAAALSAGMPLPHAIALVAAHSHGEKGTALTRLSRALDIGTPQDVAWQGAPKSLQPLRRALTLGNGTGAELSHLLVRAATDVRNSTKRDCEASVAQLAVHLMLPSGLLSLPAFFCLGIVPVLLSLLGKGW